MADSIGFLRGGDAVVEMRVSISPVGLLSIAAIVLAGAVVTGVAIREARRPRHPRVAGAADNKVAKSHLTAGTPATPG